MPRELARLKACCHESEGRVNANQCNCNALKNNERTAGFHWFVGQICFLSSLFQNSCKQVQYNRRRYTIKYKPSSVCDRTQSKVKPFLNNPTASREPHNCPRKVLHYYSSIIYTALSLIFQRTFSEHHQVKKERIILPCLEASASPATAGTSSTSVITTTSTTTASTPRHHHRRCTNKHPGHP